MAGTHGERSTSVCSPAYNAGTTGEKTKDGETPSHGSFENTFR